jgi:hypothetical protein
MQSSSHSVGDAARGSGAYSRDPLSWWDGHLDAVDGFPALREVCFTKRSKLRCINKSWDTTITEAPKTSI